MSEDSIERRLTKHAASNKVGTARAADVMGGVTVTFLMDVFHMDRRDVNRRLKDCPVIGGAKVKDSSRQLYDLATAAQYLVKPIFNPEEYLKTMKASELPVALQDGFWSAMNKRQKWEQDAKQLWRTEDVMGAMGKVFQLIKGTMQLWGENMQRSEGLKPEQKRFLQAQIDGLQKELHENLIDMPRQHEPQVAELPLLLNETGAQMDISDPKGTAHDDLI